MVPERPKLSAEHLIKYMVGRLDEIDAKLDRHHTISRRVDFLHLVWAALRWSGTVSSQISTIFIASYVAFEHSWYVAKIGMWITKILSWHL